MPPQPLSAKGRAQPPLKQASPVNPFGPMNRVHSRTAARRRLASAPSWASMWFDSPQMVFAMLQAQQHVSMENFLQHVVGMDERTSSLIFCYSGVSVIESDQAMNCFVWA